MSKHSDNKAHNDKNDSSCNNSQSHQSTTKSTSVSNFPAKLHFMLNELERDGLEYIASWQQHGRCFIVRKPKEFENKILPCYFQQSKFTSFQRQLSFYGFRRIVSGRDKGGYFHEHFLRGKEEMANQIQRTKIKGTGPRKPNSMELPVPNFYEMTFLTDNNTTKTNSNYEKKLDCLKTSKDAYEYNNQGSPKKIPEQIASSNLKRKGDDNKSMMSCIRQQERLNEIDRDLLLLSRASYNIQNYVQERKSTNNHNGMGSWSPSVVPCVGNMFPSQSVLGLLNYPSLATSCHPLLSNSNTSATLPFSMGPVGTSQISSDNSPSLISVALAKYFQQQRSC